MARESNRGRGKQSNRLHKADSREAEDQELEQQRRRNPPRDAKNAIPDDGTQMPLVPGMERDSWPGATPPGGGGGVGHSLDGRTPGDAPGRKEDRGSEVTWRKGDARRPRTGDMVENRGTKVRLTGKDAAKGRRCSVRDGSGGSVSASEAAEIAKQARSGATVGARVMLAKVGVNKGRTLPQDVVEHHKAALRFSLRVLGRPVCAGEMVKALVAFGHEPWASLGGKRKKRDGRKKA